VTVAWPSEAVLGRLQRHNPHWRQADGACPACVQQALLEQLLQQGDAALHTLLPLVWPVDPQAAFPAIPTPLRLHADPRFTGAGLTLAMVDGDFYPHLDLTAPVNRIRAWVDASHEPVQALFFGPDEQPRWPGWDAGDPAQWHGLMTSAVAAGNGWLSQGLYRGLASAADVVLVKVRGEDGISNAAIARALQWLGGPGRALGVRVVSLSVAGEPAWPNPVDALVSALVAEGISVVAAAGNDGQRRLLPPATAPEAITVGGLDDHNTFSHAELSAWHSSYGASAAGALKPELVAPSLWVAAPLVPGTPLALEAGALFAHRAAGTAGVEARLAELKLVTAHYQHVDGTSVAAPLVASAIVCMLQANPAITPRLVRAMLLATAQPVPGIAPEQQGAGALAAGPAVALALRERHSALAATSRGPEVSVAGVTFVLHDHRARRVALYGSWDGWRAPSVATQIEPGAWRTVLPHLPPGHYAYKYLVNDTHWREDPDNLRTAADGHGGFNSLLTTDPRKAASA